MFLISLSLVVLSCYFIITVQKHTGPGWVFSPPIVMMAYLLLVKFPGVLLLEDPELHFRATFAHGLWLGGIALSCFIFFRRRHPASVYRPAWFYEGNVPAYYTFVIIGIIACVFTFFMFGRAPLLLAVESMISGGGDLTMHKARQMNTLEHRYGDTVYFGQGYLRQIYAVVSPIFCSALYLYYKLRRRCKPPKAVILSMTAIVIAGAMNGQIWIAAYIIVLFILTKFYSESVTDPSQSTSALIRKGIYAYSFLVIFVFSYRYLQYLQGRYFENFFYDTLNRLYTYEVAPLFTLFGDIFPFRYGSTWVNDLMGILPGSSQNFTYEVHYLVTGAAWGFTMSPGVVASAYVNFGYTGVIITATSLTALFTAIYNKLVRSSQIICHALAIYLSFSFATGVPSDLQQYVTALITIGCVYVAYRLVAATIRPVPARRIPYPDRYST